VDDDLLREIDRRHKRALEARPDVPPEDLLFSIGGGEEEHVETYDEHNARDGPPTVFACVRTAVATPDAVVPGSARVFCARCAAEVWMSPATCQARARIPRNEVVCLHCLGVMKGGA
jgi:hypothetical protein